LFFHIAYYITLVVAAKEHVTVIVNTCIAIAEKLTEDKVDTIATCSRRRWRWCSSRRWRWCSSRRRRRCRKSWAKTTYRDAVAKAWAICVLCCRRRWW
jgi:hypothetical protein